MTLPRSMQRKAGLRSAYGLPALFLLVALFAAGCAVSYDWTFDREDIADFTAGSKALPLRVGVHYTEDFRAQQLVYRYGFEHVGLIGQSNVRLYNDLLPSLFQSVKVVDMSPPYQCEIEDVDLLLVFDSGHSYFRFGFGNDLKGVRADQASISYSTTMFVPKGDEVAHWMSTGVGIQRGGMLAFKRVQDTIDEALREAAEGFPRMLREALAKTGPDLGGAETKFCEKRTTTRENGRQPAAPWGLGQRLLEGVNPTSTIRRSPEIVASIPALDRQADVSPQWYQGRS